MMAGGRWSALKQKKTAAPLLMLALFEAVALLLALLKHNAFYFFNFTYIGGCLALGLALYERKWPFARHFVQLAVGLYMLVYLGLLHRENMQIEGFWYYLFLGAFEAATIHYAVAKIFGPLIFGRGWCGYACWTAMVLDLLPFRRPAAPRLKLGWLRYVTFAASLIFVLALFWLRVPGMDEILFRSFIAGNLLYYAAGILLAFRLKDNRAFCKYLCPVTVFLKPMSRFALLRIRVDREKCVSCGACRRACPMDVDLLRDVNRTECILCLQCTGACRQGALKF